MYVNPFWLGFLVGIVFALGLIVVLVECSNRRKK